MRTAAPAKDGVFMAAESIFIQITTGTTNPGNITDKNNTRHEKSIRQLVSAHKIALRVKCVTSIKQQPTAEFIRSVTKKNMLLAAIVPGMVRPVKMIAGVFIVWILIRM